jgi:hypothetical protein
MSIAIESYSVDAADSTSDVTISPSVPSGTQDGDLLVAIGITDGDRTLSAPAGWTQFISGGDYSSKYIFAWHKLASSESGNYDFTASSTYNNARVIVLRISGSDAETAPTGSAHGDGTWDNSINCPDKEVTTANSMLIWCCNSSGTGSPTFTSNRGTELYDGFSATADAMAVYYEIIAGTGNQTGAVITRSAAINEKSGGVILISPATTNRRRRFLVTCGG